MSVVRTRNPDMVSILMGESSVAMSEALAVSAQTAEHLADGIASFQHEGNVWLELDGYYAQLAILNTLKEVRLPIVSSSHCIFKEGQPKYLRVSMLKPHSPILVLKASEQGEDETDALIDFMLKQNDADLCWPADDTKSVKFFEYYALLKGQVGKTVYDSLNTSGTQLTAVYLRESQGSMMIVAVGNVLIPYGEKLLASLQNSTIYEFENQTLSQLRFVPTTEKTEKVLLGNAEFAHKLGKEKLGLHTDYSGVGFVPGPQNSVREIGVSSRVLMDPQGCHQVEPQFFTSMYSALDYRVNTHGREPTLVSLDALEHRLNVVSMVMSYDLKTSQWFCGHPSRTSEISFSNHAFDELVLEDDIKELIHACVLHRTAKLDAIANKDTGALFLLSGAPGTGKTLCAESVAELLRKPLYKVGMGELGTDAQLLDQNLQRILRLAERWSAILLLDEADVFMSKRGDDLERNALVATALKHLEYYCGTLMLTTNMSSNIDPAFKSRITMAVHFPEPTVDKMSSIWRTLLKRAGFDQTALEPHMGQLLSYKVNGREIKNTCSTALALARFRNVTPSIDHLVAVLEKWREFAAHDALGVATDTNAGLTS